MRPREWDGYYQVKAKLNKGLALNDVEAAAYIKAKADIRRAESKTYLDFEELKRMRNG